MTRWLLRAVEIEGFRGINNEGDPLLLTFDPDTVSSISAPNGVGKTSVFDALTFAIRGSIKKLDQLAASERTTDYYINLFHPSKAATVKLTLVPDGGGSPIQITVSRNATNGRLVSGPTGVDAVGILKSLDRDFVLVDQSAFKAFIDDKPLDRGRAFSGLLGLSRYSELRQELQALSNTKAFNNHAGVAGLQVVRSNAELKIKQGQAKIATDFSQLTGKAMADQSSVTDAKAAAHFALAQIELLKPHCDGKLFDAIDTSACLTAIQTAEDSDGRIRLSKLIDQEGLAQGLLDSAIPEARYLALRALTAKRDELLADTAGPLMRDLLALSEAVLTDDSWTEPLTCPTCDHTHEEPVLDRVKLKVSRYEAADAAGRAIEAEWAEGGWSSAVTLEAATRQPEETALIEKVDREIGSASLTTAQLEALWSTYAILVKRAQEQLDKTKAERLELERKLPKQLVAVTTKVEAARRLQVAWRDLGKNERELGTASAALSQRDRLKRFLDAATTRFSAAETAAGTRRLAAVEPICRDFFKEIMHEPVKPALIRHKDKEELALGLAEFWSARDVSAQALLSESYRNAFAVSVYLAAASLYGGAPLFVVFDDISSSFDSGNQFHLMELIKTKFARPGHSGGVQAIILSHDTLLEKLFQKNVQTGGWKHYRLEGTARTAILPQSQAQNRLRDKAVDLLNAGQVIDASHLVRQYLEFKLIEVISRVRVPVPVDFALNDHKKMAQDAIDAIGAAVKLHVAANQISLDATQQQQLNLNTTTIVGNFLAHYATGATMMFSSGSLLGVLDKIDNFARCFMIEDPPGSGTFRYYKSLTTK